MTSAVTVVVGCRWYEVRAPEDSESLTRELTVTLDGQFEWTFDIPSWRPVNVGVAGEDAYVWSARDVIVLPRDGSDDPITIEVVDDDLLFAFRVDDGWVLVCESSVLRVLGQKQTARWELPDVVMHASWQQGVLLVRDDAGRETRFTVSGPDLAPAS